MKKYKTKTNFIKLTGITVVVYNPRKLAILNHHKNRSKFLEINQYIKFIHDIYGIIK